MLLACLPTAPLCARVYCAWFKGVGKHERVQTPVSVPPGNEFGSAGIRVAPFSEVFVFVVRFVKSLSILQRLALLRPAVRAHLEAMSKQRGLTAMIRYCFFYFLVLATYKSVAEWLPSWIRFRFFFPVIFRPVCVVAFSRTSVTAGSHTANSRVFDLRA